MSPEAIRDVLAGLGVLFLAVFFLGVSGTELVNRIANHFLAGPPGDRRCGVCLQGRIDEVQLARQVRISVSLAATCAGSGFLAGVVACAVVQKLAQGH